jgi:hypothetical protein
MNSKRILFGLILILIIFNSTFVFAESKNIKYYYDNIDTEKQVLLDNITSLPNLIQNILKNDKIQFEIDTNNEKLNLFLEKTKDGNYNITKENIEKINVWIIAKEDSINQIINSEDPLQELNNKIKSKEVKIKTKGFFRTIKFKLVQLFLRFKR